MLRSPLIILRFDRQINLGRELTNLLLEAPFCRLLRTRFRPEQCRRLIDHVDGFIWQLPLRNIALRQFDRHLHRLAIELHAMMFRQARRQPLHHARRHINIRLIDRHRLKSSPQRRILLNMFAIFFKRRRTNDAHFAACQRRLEHVRRVHRTFRRASAHQQMQFIDKQDDFLMFFDRSEYFLQTLLKLPTVLRARHHRRQIELDNSLTNQKSRHVSLDDALRQPLDHRCFTNTWLADERRIVLGASPENGHHALCFLVSPNHWIELVMLRLRCQIDAIFFEHTQFTRTLLRLCA